MADQTSVPYGVRNKIASMQKAIAGSDWGIDTPAGNIPVKAINLWTVLFAMSQFVFGDAGECWASRKTLREITGLSESTIERAQNCAVQSGLCKLAKEKKRIGTALYPVYCFTIGWLEDVENIIDPSEEEIARVDALIKADEEARDRWLDEHNGDMCDCGRPKYDGYDYCIDCLHDQPMANIDLDEEAAVDAAAGFVDVEV